VSHQLLRVGWAAGNNGDTNRWIYRLGVGLASAAALCSVWAFIVTTVVFSARSERIQARNPVFAGPGSPVIGQWLERVDETSGGRQFSVVFLLSSHAGDPPPPGIPRWPEPGQEFLSPALLAQPESPDLRHRYGRYQGRISLAGLADPGELLAYVGLRVVDPSPSPLRTKITGFGGGGPGVYSFASQGTDRRLADIYWVLSCLLAMPTIVFAVVAVRSSGETRDRRITLLDELGAPRRVQVLMLAGESVRPIAVGALVAMMALFLMTVYDSVLPVTGYHVAATDLAIARPYLLIATLAVVACMLTLSVGLHSRPRRRPTTNSRGFGAPIPPRRLALLGLGAALAAGGAAIGHSLGQRIFLLGFIATLTGAPLLAGRLSARLGILVARAGARRGRPAAIVGGRWLAARPATIARMSAALIIGLGLLLQLQVRTTAYTADEGAASAVYRQVGSSILTVQTRGLNSSSLADFETQVGPRHGVITVDQVGDGPTVLTAPCGVLRGVGTLRHCPRKATPMQDIYARETVRTLAVRYWSEIVDRHALVRSAEGTPSATTVGLLVLNGDGYAGLAQVKDAAYAHFRAPIIESPGEAAVGGAKGRVRLAGWLMLFGALGLLVLALMAAVSAAGTFVQQAGDLGPLATYSSSPRFFVAVAMWNVTTPLVIAALIGCGVSSWLALLGLSLSGAGSQATLSMDLVLASVVVLGSCAVAAGALCAVGAARAAQTWRPTAD